MRALCMLVLVLIFAPPAQAQAIPQQISHADAFVEQDYDLQTLITAISSDASLVAWYGSSPDSPKGIHLLDTSTGSEVAALDSFEAVAMAFNPDGTLLAVAGKGGNLLVIKVEAWTRLGHLTPDKLQSSAVLDDLLGDMGLLKLASSNLGVKQMVFNEESSVLLLATLTLDRNAPIQVLLWDISESPDIKALAESSNFPEADRLDFDTALRFDPFQFSALEKDFQAVSQERQDQEITFTRHKIEIDLAAGQAALADDPNPVTFSAAFTGLPLVKQSADGDTLLIYSQSLEAVTETDVMNLKTGTSTTLSLPDGLRTAAISPVADRVVTVSKPATIQVWDTATGQEVFKLDGGRLLSGSMSAAFSSDGTKLVLVGRNSIQTWELE